MRYSDKSERYNNWFLAESEYNGILLFNFDVSLHFFFVPDGVIEYFKKARRSMTVQIL